MEIMKKVNHDRLLYVLNLSSKSPLKSPLIKLVWYLKYITRDLVEIF